MIDRREELRLQEFSRINPRASASAASFDIITGLVQRILDVPIAAITLIDKDTLYLKARQGIEIAQCPRDVAVCDIVVRSGQPLVIGNMEADDRVAENPGVTGAAGLRAYAGAPLTTRGGHHLGALCVLDTAPHWFSPEQISLLTHFAKLVTELLELRAMADTDFLTELLNRRSFETVLEREMARLDREGSTATLAILDLDHFKLVNDNYGHPVGDAVLKALSKLLSGDLRRNDYLARIGGEEFALLLTNTPLNKAISFADRIRETVASHRFDEYPGLSLTVSIGLVEITNEDKDLLALMREADDALYYSKSVGRNSTSFTSKGQKQYPGDAELLCG